MNSFIHLAIADSLCGWIQVIMLKLVVGLQATYSLHWSSLLSMNGHWFSSLFCPPFGVKLLDFNSWLLNAGSGANCIITPSTFVSYTDFWAPFQPHSTRWPVAGAWEAGHKCGHEWYGWSSGFGNCKMGSQKAPWGIGDEDQRLCLYLNYRPWDFQSLGSWHSMESSKLQVSGTDEWRPTGSLIKWSRKEQSHRGDAVPVGHHLCFSLSQALVFSFLPTVTI